MAAVHEVYRCEVCGNVGEVLFSGGGQLVCCGKPMTKQEEKSADSKTEKHVPVIEKTSTGYKVTVGSTLHPMIDTHFIQWIELTADGKVYKEYLKPGMAPAAEFCVMAEKVSAREYCNIHGLWKS